MNSSPKTTAAVLSRIPRFSRFQKSWKSAALTLLALGGVARAVMPSTTVTMDFQVLEQGNGNFNTGGNHYEEDGYQLDVSSSFPNPFPAPAIVTIGTGAAPQYCGSTAVHANISFGIITVTPIAGGSFTPTSVKLAHLVNPNVNGSATVHFSGRLIDGSFVYQNFSLAGVAYGTQQTFNFGPQFTDIFELSCTEITPFFQVDDFVLAEGSIKTTFAILLSQGTPVPGAGTDPRIQAGAVWTGFGPPAVNEGGSVAYIGKWKAPAIPGTVPVPAQSGVGLFVDSVLVAKVGESLNGGDTLWKSFKDPVLAADGSVAFLGAVKGPSVTTTTDSVAAIWTGSAPTIVAREGDPAPVHASLLPLTQTWKAFTSIARISGATGLSGTVARSSGMPVNVPTLAGGLDGVELQPLLQRDVPVDNFGNNVASFSALKTGAGSPGQGRGALFTDGGAVRMTANVKSITGESLAVAVNVQDGSFETIASAKSLGLISIWNAVPGGGAAASQLLAFRATDFGATAAGIYNGNPYSPVVSVGSDAGAPAGTTWKSFKDPVQSSNDSVVAFSAQLNGATTANDNGIWWSRGYGGTNVKLVAREGDQPPAAPGAQWKSFSSLALPAGTGGPIFTAMLQKGVGTAPGPGGITSVDDFGLYGVDSQGVLVQLIRENRPLLGKTVKTFNVLKAVSGTAGSTRSFNATGHIVVLVTFTDNTTAIVRISVPQLPIVGA